MRDLELESESYFESENLAEPFLGGLLGESESEGEGFGDGFGESFGESETFFEGFGEGEGESEGEGPLGEFENEQFYESEGEGYSFENEGEQFFGKAFKKIGGFIKKAAPILKKIAKVAAPIVGTAIGGPIGGKIGSMATQLLGESESEGYFESENEAQMEAVLEGPMSEQQALGELMAAAAARAATDMEAEAQIGGATAIVLSPADRDALRGVLPSINRGVAVLTRILRRDPATRPAVRVIPAIVKRSAVALRNQAASGRPLTRQSAARAVATQTRRVLSSPATCAKAVQRNVNATRAAARNARGKNGYGGGRPRPRYAI
jgi:hypothetical protein